VEYVMQIRKLLYEDGFTIAGARERLREETRTNRARNKAPEQTLSEVARSPQGTLPFLAPVSDADPKLRQVRQQLREVLDLLS
jgi:hypothetical protein